MYEIKQSEELENAKEDYKNGSLDQYENKINNLINEKREYMKKIDFLQHSINELREKKQFFCYSTGGHKWVTEREGGIYGELFTYCEKCKKEGY